MNKVIKQWWDNIVILLSTLVGYNAPHGGMKNMTASTVSSSDSGDIILGFGLHEITVKTEGRKPARVSLSVQDPCGGIPCCVGDVNKIGFTLSSDGFVLYADIRTNTCCVEWECDF